MATNRKKKKVSELPEATDTTGFWIFGSKTVGGAVTSVKFAFDKITSLFGITQEKGQSITLAPSQKLFTDEIDKLDTLINSHIGNNKIHLSETEEPGFAICDSSGNCVYFVGADGISKINFDIDFASEFIKSIFENGFAVSDTNGNASLFVDKKGETDLKLSKVALKRLKNQLDNLDTLLRNDYNMIIGYGQSLSEGALSRPVLTTSAFSDMALMFNHGIKTRYATEPKYQSFVPHFERLDAENGETPCAGLADMFIKVNNMDVSDSKYIVSSCCGRGAMNIDQLAKGTTWYNNIIADVTNAKRLADETGKTFGLLAITWTQGESDQNRITADVYKQKLIQLRADIIQDIQTITGDDYSELPFIMYQFSASYSWNNTAPAIAFAQYELAMEDNHFYMATPIYQFPYSDNWVHLTNIYSKLLGAYYGFVLDKVLKGEDWQPLAPANHSVVGNDLYVQFTKKGLTFETPVTITDTIINHGFSILNGSTEIIQNVNIISEDTLKITCSSSPTGLTLTYGNNNLNKRNGGDLRDSQEYSYNVAGVDYPLRNWCVIFKYKL